MDALIERPVRGNTAHPVTFHPTPAQWRYLREYLAHGGQNNLKAIAAKANVNWRTIYDWREDDRYNDWFRSECQRHFNHVLPLVRRVAVEYALQGSPEHIKLVMQWAGITNAGSNDQRTPATMGVYINVPRPADALTEQHHAALLDTYDAAVVTEQVTAHEPNSNG